MFDLLKKKISSFIGGLTKRGEEKKPTELPKELIEEKKESGEKKQVEAKKEFEIEAPPLIAEIKKSVSIAEKQKPVSEESQIQKPIPKPLLKPLARAEIQDAEIKHEEKKPVKIPEMKKESATPNHEEKKVRAVPEEKVSEKKQEKKEEKKPEPKPEKKPERTVQRPEIKEPERKAEVKLGLAGHIKGLVFGEIEIQKSDVSDLLDGLEMDLLESDVSYSVTEEIKQEMEKKLVGLKVKRGDVSKSVRNMIKSSLVRISGEKEGADIIDFVNKSEKPIPIMFLGVNGAGKTTTIAKVAKLLIDNGLKVVFSASDTFRAAAIEQMEVHGNRLGVRVIKRPYGSDPTAVAFDAVNHSKASGIDVVLIDTAGRQETNQSLMTELKKMVRVIQPKLKFYVGESIAGSAIIDQVNEFNKELGGIDGVILTKLDCDAKGGAVISIPHATGVPISYIGTGQGYSDLERFDSEKIIGAIVGEN